MNRIFFSSLFRGICASGDGKRNHTNVTQNVAQASVSVASGRPRLLEITAIPSRRQDACLTDGRDGLLRHLRHALPVQPNFADAFYPREDVIHSLAAEAQQFRAHDARHKIAGQIQNLLRVEPSSPLQRMAVIARVSVCTSGPSVIRMCAFPSSSTCR